MGVCPTLARSTFAALTALLGACAAAPAPLDPATPATTGRVETSQVDDALAPTIQLPSDWRTVSERSFEELALALLPGEPRRLAEADRAELAAALAGTGPGLRTAVRAAVLLARCREREAAEVLLARLEARVDGPERNSDAPDVVAASGLAELRDEVARCDAAARLAALAAGPEPHPDLEVRVECGRAALRLGDDTVVPLLLSVLRIGTRTGRAEGTFWPAPMRSAWARERAAEVLAWRAGVDNTFSADAALDDRDAFADRLAVALETILARTR